MSILMILSQYGLPNQNQTENTKNYNQDITTLCKRLFMKRINNVSHMAEEQTQKMQVKAFCLKLSYQDNSRFTERLSLLYTVIFIYIVKAFP